MPQVLQIKKQATPTKTPRGRQGTPLGVYIVYMGLPENPGYPCKPPWGHILGLNIPTILLGIPQGVAINLPMIYMLGPPGGS